MPLLTGFLSKTNRYGIKQRRFFVLYTEGEIHYFKEAQGHIKERLGVLRLLKDARAIKTGKKSF